MPVHLFESSELIAQSPGMFRTPVMKPEVPCLKVVASWNQSLPLKGGVEVWIRVQQLGDWSPWLLLARRGMPVGEAPAYPEGLSLNGDEVCSATNPIEAAELEVRLDGEASAPRRLGLCFWPRFAKVALPEDEVLVDVTVPRVRQYLIPEIGSRVCGPSSLSMALAHFGQEVSPTEVATAVYDPWFDIYGNWSHLAAYAAERGLAAWVERGGGPARLAEHFGKGRLVILSLQWTDHELPGAALPRSAGHLVLALGAQESGVVVLDPAFKDAKVVRTVYPWQGLLRAWKSGAAIVVGPEESLPRV